jgi:hypothetical protein
MSQLLAADQKDRLSDDLVWGVSGNDGIAAFIGVSERKARYLIERNALPIKQFGRTIVASKTELRRIFAAGG